MPRFHSLICAFLPRSSFSKVSRKVPNTRPSWPCLSFNMVGHCCCYAPSLFIPLPCHRTCTSAASFRPLRLISGIVITPTHSLSSHYHQLSSSSSHHTLHRISGIVQRGSRNRPPLMDSSAVLPQSITRFPHPICPRLLSWAFVILRTQPLYNSRTMFSELLFLAPMPPLSPRFLSYSLIYLSVTVVWNLPHSLLASLFLVPLSIIPP